MFARDAIAAAALALMVGLIVLAPRPVVDNSVHALLSADDEGVDDYRMFAAQFGTDEIVVAQIEAPDFETLVADTASVAQLLRKDEYTTEVIDPTVVYAATIAVLTDEVLRNDDAKRDFASPLGRALRLVDPDRNTSTIYAFSKPTPPAQREPLIARLEAARSRLAAHGTVARFAGPPLLNLTLDRAGREVAAVALPLLVGVCLLVCLLTLRSVRATIAVFLPPGLTVLASDGAYALTGWTTNLVVDIAKPLLFVLLLAGALHIAAAYRHAFAGDARSAADKAIRAKGKAATLALVTTAIGFSSLGLSTIAPIRRFGVVTSVGLLFGVITVVVVVPAIAKIVWPRPAPLDADPIAKLAVTAVQYATPLRTPIIVVSALIVLAGGWAFTRLPTEPHAIRYFSPDHPLRADYEAMAASGIGLSTLELVVTSSVPFTDFRKLDGMATRLAAMPGVNSVVGLPLLLREAAFRSTGRDVLLDNTFNGAVVAERPAMLGEFLTTDGKTARLAATITMLDADQMDTIAAAFPSARITGSYRLLLAAQRGLLETLTESLVVTFILMQLILFAAVRSIRLGLIAIAPNIVPVAATFLVMTALGIKLDIGTAMTAAIALGIAVDDTLHFILAYREHGLQRAAQVTGQAIVTSSLVIGAGFLVLMTSNFGPTRSFGLLAGVAMLAALLADLLLLPALLSSRQP